MPDVKFSEKFDKNNKITKKVAQAYLKLKQIKRSGWIRPGLKDCESVADHSFGVAMLCMLHCPGNLNKEKVIKMALVHDLSEVEVGDLTPYDKGYKGKEKRELLAIKTLNHDEITQLRTEYSNQKTGEAEFVRDMDLVEMVLQAKDYSHKINIDEFIAYPKGKMKTDVGKQLFNEIIKGE